MPPSCRLAAVHLLTPAEPGWHATGCAKMQLSSNHMRVPCDPRVIGGNCAAQPNRAALHQASCALAKSVPLSSAFGACQPPRQNRLTGLDASRGMAWLSFPTWMQPLTGQRRRLRSRQAADWQLFMSYRIPCWDSHRHRSRQQNFSVACNKHCGRQQKCWGMTTGSTSASRPMMMQLPSSGPQQAPSPAAHRQAAADPVTKKHCMAPPPPGPSRPSHQSRLSRSHQPWWFLCRDIAPTVPTSSSSKCALPKLVPTSPKGSSCHRVTQGSPPTLEVSEEPWYVCTHI